MAVLVVVLMMADSGSGCAVSVNDGVGGDDDGIHLGRLSSRGGSGGDLYIH
jgi:hypothetical protein